MIRKSKKVAKSKDRQVYARIIFHGIFDLTAPNAYMENETAYEQLFLDAEKYRIIQKHLQGGYIKNCTAVRIMLSQGDTAWLFPKLQNRTF